MNLNKALSTSVVIFTLGFSVMISAAPKLSESMEVCAKQSDSRLRLACYDNLSRALAEGDIKESQKAHSDTLPSNATPTPDNSSEHNVAKRQVKSIERFGLTLKAEAQEETEQISAVITKIQRNPYGKLQITLNNGQLWQQTDSTRIYLVEGDSIVIKTAAFGSFFMSKESINKRIRVKRNY